MAVPWVVVGNYILTLDQRRTLGYVQPAAGNWLGFMQVGPRREWKHVTPECANKDDAMMLLQNVLHHSAAIRALEQ